MMITFVIPAYNAAKTIDTTLGSVFAPEPLAEMSLEVIVADDGSSDREKLLNIIGQYPQVKYCANETNKGKIAAVNLAISQTKGDVIIILDADDTLVPDWPQRLSSILPDWPEDALICFSACQTQNGETTVSRPDYDGPQTFGDIISETYAGEYLPMFRGDKIRELGGYLDPQMPWGCEMWTYLRLSKTYPVWISSTVLRVYHYDRPGSLTHSRNESKTASQISRCHELVLDEFESDFIAHSPRYYFKRRLRQSVYLALSGDMSKAFRVWKENARVSLFVESAGALLFIVLGSKFTSFAIRIAKSLGLVKKFG
ncbi:glycosyltransferase family 2 protein [Magnetovibrio sp. PR-2]|uniref:glycosyltransferase family 2 protein n=1 Tax=Magnetovibrio sp. PR-2 TaxID=3120356 RepID=UPI002FCE144D